MSVISDDILSLDPTRAEKNNINKIIGIIPIINMKIKNNLKNSIISRLFFLVFLTRTRISSSHLVSEIYEAIRLPETGVSTKSSFP